MARASPRISITNALLRILLYYIGFLAIFQCPLTSPLDDTAPALCSPLHRSVNAVRPLAKASYRYIEPHVDALWEYVEPPLQPFMEPIQVFHTNYVAPAIVGAERVLNQAQTNPKLAVWRGHVADYLAPYQERMQTLITGSQDYVHQLLAPYISRVQPIVTWFSSHTARICSRTAQLISENVYPSVHAVVVKCHDSGLKFYSQSLQPFITNKVMPYINQTVLPVLRLYIGKLVHYGHIYGSKMIDYVWIWVDKALRKAKAEYIPKAWDFWKEKVNKQLVRVMDHIYSVAYTEKKGVSSNSAIDVVNEVDVTDEVDVSETNVNVDLLSTSSPMESTDIVTKKSAQSVNLEDKIIFTTTETETVMATVSNSVVTSQATEIKAEKTGLASALGNYATLINSTYSSAFSNLNTTLENEKGILLNGSSVIFTKKLQSMQQELTKALQDVNSLIESIMPKANNTLEIMLSEEELNDIFKNNADLLRSKAMDIRRMSELLANEAIEKTEDLRSKTLDVLDEFSEVVSSQLGKFIMDYSLANPSEVNGQGTDEENASEDAFSPWVSYSGLLRQLEHNRREITEFSIPMDDVNLFLREVQETANFLAREIGAQFQGLRGKAHFAFQERARVETSAPKDEPSAQDWPIDAEIYDEIEEAAGTITKTLTQIITTITQSDSPVQSDTSVQAPSSSDNLENFEEALVTKEAATHVKPSSLEPLEVEATVSVDNVQESDVSVLEDTPGLQVGQVAQHVEQVAFNNVQIGDEIVAENDSNSVINKDKSFQVDLDNFGSSVLENNTFSVDQCDHEPEIESIHKVEPLAEVHIKMEVEPEINSDQSQGLESETIMDSVIKDSDVLSAESRVKYETELPLELVSGDPHSRPVAAEYDAESKVDNTRSPLVISAVTELEIEQPEKIEDSNDVSSYIVEEHFSSNDNISILDTPIDEAGASMLDEGLSEQALESPI